LGPYLGYLVPVSVVLYARVAAAAGGIAARRAWLALVMTGAGIATQRPWQRMSVDTYFRDWFPYYLTQGRAMVETPLPVWPVWGWYLTVAAASLVAVWAMSRSIRSR
jgi:hypothetical protein